MNLGRPFAADASAGVFYPGKLIFMLPFPFSTCLVLYTALHLLVAAYTTFRVARYFKATALASIIAALSFSLGGAVLSQHANIIFLVSAAWLPLGLLYGLQLIRNENRSRVCVLLSICLALMLLGGDPQAVVHLIIVLLVCWFILPRYSPQVIDSRSSIATTAKNAAGDPVVRRRHYYSVNRYSTFTYP